MMHFDVLTLRQIVINYNQLKSLHYITFPHLEESNESGPMDLHHSALGGSQWQTPRLV